MTPWTSVVSYHTDPETCGVARFSAQLARRLGIPHLGLLDEEHWGDSPLFSIKFAELLQDESAAVMLAMHMRRGDYLWHDEPPTGTAWHVRKQRNADRRRTWKLYELGVPALVEPVQMAPQALFTFGMAHKIDLKKFIELKETFPLDQLWISTAAHEGAGPSRVQELMRAWGRSARDLGHLSDAALQLIWPHVLAFVAFFEHGLRANNSSVHAALDAGVPVITNWGAETPQDLRNVTHDYRAFPAFPFPHAERSPYTWARLLKELGCAT